MPNMTRYHQKDNGEPGVCKAEVRNCPVSALDEDHVNAGSIAEAKVLIEIKNQEQHEKSHGSATKGMKRLSPQEEAEKVLAERGSSTELMELIEKRDQAREEFKEAKKKSKKLSAAYYRNKIENNHTKYRKARFAERDAYYAHIEANKDLEDYKDESALLAAKLSETAFEEEYEGDTLGDSIRTAEFPSGSREWLEHRQNGVGGSDAGAVFKVDPEWSSSNYTKAWESKINPITDEEVEAQQTNNNEFSGAAGRGNAWEPLIAKRFADNNPGYGLLHSKSSWVNKDRPWQVANFDGILKDKKTGEMGILEIKTASDSSKWEKGVPPGYKAQVLHYLDTTGFKYAHVAVVIDEHDYRSFRVDHDEPLVDGDPRTYVDRRHELEEFFQKAQEEKGKLKKKSSVKSNFSFSDKKTKDMVVKELAAFRQEDPEAIRARLEEKTSVEDADHDAIIRDEYISYDPSTRTKDIVSIDLETSSGSPARGEIIEVGVVRTNAKGEIVDKYQALFDIDERAKRVNGTGEESVHNISPKDIEGKPRFNDPEVQKRMKEIMGLEDNNTVMEAHNAPFENRWLNQNLDGFHKAKLGFIDTMRIARYFDHGSKNNTLSEFTQAHGVAYENAHRAYDDALMTSIAFENFLKELKEKRDEENKK